LSIELRITDPLGERAFAAADFPLSIGGTGCTVALPGLPAEPAAWLALQDGQLFLQSAAAAPTVRCNGVALHRSVWLQDADVIDAGGGRLRLQLRAGQPHLTVEDGSGGNLTLPPLPIDAAVLSGGGGEDEIVEPVTFVRTAPLPRRRAIPARSLLVTACAALLAFTSWLLFTGRSVEIVTTPAADSVRLSGGFSLPFGRHQFARPGSYEVVARKRGYVPLRQSIEVTKAAGQRYVFALQKLPGRLRVQSAVAGTVAIDGVAVGTTPGEFKLAPGKHTVVVSAERHLPFQRQIDIAGEDRQQALQAQLVPAWAALTVLSEPSGAEVRIGGKAQGRTPLKVELAAGSHRIDILHPGFKTWTTDVQIVASQPQQLGPVRLGLPDSRLAVRSNPAGANVSVGGAFRGRTPIDIVVRPETPLSLVLAKDGYESATSSVTLAAGEQRGVDLSLTPILGEVTVRARPEDAEVFVDGRLLGKAGKTVSLTATAHAIEVRAAGFQAWRTTVTPRPGLPQLIEARLEEARPGAPPAAVANAAATTGSATATTSTPATPARPTAPPARAGQDLKLAPSGSFTMGSARREAGRRANESQRPVELRRRFYVATREVTNAEFKRFKPEHRSGFIGQNTLERDRQPVVNVSWQEAAAYCNWLSKQEGLPAAYEDKGGRLVPVVPATTGYRLPTEAEWEWVARSNRDGSLRKYPWGEALPVPQGAGNFGDRTAQPLLTQILGDYDDGQPVAAPVGSFGANALGYYDLGGNVAEWTSDSYAVQPAGAAVAVDPLAAGDAKLHVIRGSSWRHATVTELRLAFRDYGDGGRDDLGFRIARYGE